MNKLIWISVLALLCFGCKSKVPKDIIQPDQMQKILYDIHIVDGYISTIPITDSARKVSAAYYNGIYKKFNTDSARYNQSLKYYYAHPTELDLMYKNISRTLQKQKKMMEKADSVNRVKVAKIDSVRRVKKAKMDSVRKFKAVIK